MDATVTVQSVESVGPDTVAVVFAVPPEFEGRPGQFLKLTATVDGEEYARFYTLSSPDVEDTCEITVEDTDEGGPMSGYLADLTAGDEVDVTGPFGHDYYEGESRVVVLAGGPGVGPAVGIGERALADGAEVVIVYRDDEPAHRRRLETLADRGATVTITGGGITDAVAGALTGAEGEQVFVYGFAEFVGRATDAIEAAGGVPSEAKVENFG